VWNKRVALKASLQALMPIGVGLNKACINAFGAKQFHPILQSSMLEQYSVYLYVTVNTGALLGMPIISVLAQTNVGGAYLIPLFSLLIRLLVLVIFSRRYVKTPPPTSNHQKHIETHREEGWFVHSQTYLLTVLIDSCTSCISGYSFYYCICVIIYSYTVVQGNAMKPLGLMDASVMQCSDPIAVLIFGYLTGNIPYPFLARRNIKISTTHKICHRYSFLCIILWLVMVC
jgi:POT family proton-dependent oligopeptide transporter